MARLREAGGDERVKKEKEREQEQKRLEWRPEFCRD